MSSKVGTRFTLDQARSLGATQTFQPFGTRRGPGIWSLGTEDSQPNHVAGGTELAIAGTSGSDQVWSALAVNSQTFASGRLVLYLAWETDTALANLSNTHNIGSIWRGFGDFLLPEDRAVFRPSVGQDTDGNVRVMRNGATTTGQVTYPTINDGAIFTNIVINQDLGQTEFYVQKNPVVDQPDEVINTTPEFVRSFGGLIDGTATGETLKMTLVGYIYIP